MSRAKADEVAEMGRATARARNGNARYQVDDEDGGGDGEHRSLFERAGNRLCRLRPIGALRTRFELWHNAGKPGRMLEIGPGRKRNPGFETLNIVGGYHVNYVLDARSKLPFKDETFELLYASHILEHIPWYQTDATLKEWTRVLRPGGKLQIWVPDGL
ncbi:MAG TPA: methyltransferase domain-containing protein, partial [Methylomirabilota bacterium]|nr:methyltransferase domain-containing protein [Methylomirabilota bacterium]